MVGDFGAKWGHPVPLCWHPGKHRVVLPCAVPAPLRQISAVLSLEKKDQDGDEGSLKPRDVFWAYGQRIGPN